MNFDKIPKELRELDRWVCWRWEERTKKDGTPDDPAKMPINPATGGRAMSNNPATWGTFEDAVKAAEKGNIGKVDVCGIGFMFNGDGIVGVDIDHCKENGALTEQARDIISTLDSYTEWSQSGNGIHIICQGKLPEGGRRKSNVEMYATGRYFIMTGDVLDDAHCEIEERTAELAEVHTKYISAKKQGKNVQKMNKNVKNTSVFLTDDEIIEIALNAKNGDLFASLMNGNWKGTYSSPSEADLGLCNLLAFYTGKDAAMMDRIFRRSGLYRDKWDERRGEGGTYGQITIAKAISDCAAVYQLPTQQRLSPGLQKNLEIYTGFDQLVEQQSKVELPEWINGPYNDVWNAQRIIDRYGKDIKYNFSKGCWYLWNGSYWEEDRTGKIRNKAKDTVAAVSEYSIKMKYKYGSDDKNYKSFVSWISRSRNTSKLDNMLKEVMYWDGVAVLPEDLDSNPWLLCCKNGTVDLRTGKLQEHKREDLITKMSPVEYIRGAKAPLWEKFLERIFDAKKDLIEFMQRAVGYSLTGSTREQAVFVCYGSGANGKSTFIGVVQDLMGEYARNTNFTTFTVRNDSNTNDIARLVGARFVTAMEVGEDKRMNEALIKQLTGGDKISARFLHKEFFDFTPTFKIWMGANHKPRIKETDNGIWRRLKLIPFEVTIPEAERDKDLPKKLKAELPGIFAWAVEGCLKWQKEGLKPPKEVDAATQEYRSEMDILQEFLSECIEESNDDFVKSGDLYKVYEIWCEQNGEYKFSSTKFALKLKERGIKKGRTKSMRIWDGIKLSEYGNRLLYGISEGKRREQKYEQEELLWDDI